MVFFSFPLAPIGDIYIIICHEMEIVPRYWPFVRGIRSLVDSPYKASVTWSFDVFFDVRLNFGVAGDLRRHEPHYDVTLIRIKVCMPFD